MHGVSVKPSALGWHQQISVVSDAWRGGDLRVTNVLKTAWRWVRVENGGIMDEYVTMVGFWIFSTIVVLVAAGLIWAALSGDLQAMVKDLTNLF